MTYSFIVPGFLNRRYVYKSPAHEGARTLAVLLTMKLKLKHKKRRFILKEGKPIICLLFLFCIDTQDGAGNTSFMESARFASLEVLIILNEFGADASITNIKGESVTHICVSFPTYLPSQKRLQCLHHLIRHSHAPINTQDKKGDTPLHKACVVKGATESTIVLLLREGADSTLRNNKGETPLFAYLQYVSLSLQRAQSAFFAIPHSPRFNDRLYGLKALFAMTPKSKSMLTDKNDRTPSIIRVGSFTVFQEVFIRDGVQSLQQLAVHEVRRLIGMRQILTKSRFWRKLPWRIQNMICDLELRNALKMPTY